MVPSFWKAERATSIAAVNGAAVGAGFGLALACDFRFAGTGAFFEAPFIGMGLRAGDGISYFLPQITGMQDALDFMLTGRRVPAQEAKDPGIAWRVSDSPVDDVPAYADVLAGQPLAALTALRRVLHDGLDADLETQVLLEEPCLQAAAVHAAEFRRRFAEYRRPVAG